MSKGRLFGLVSLIASSFVVWLYIVTVVPPNKNDLLLMATFFASLTVWLGSLFAYLIYVSRVKRGNREVIYAYIKPSIRQGLLMSSTVVILLYLQFLRVISIWDAILVIFVAILFEIAFRHSPLDQKLS